MKLELAILTSALLAGAFKPAAAQAKAPDYAEVTRLQTAIQKAEAKGDWEGAAIDLRLLVRLYKDDAPMRSITYSQLANVYTQAHNEKKAAEYRAMAQNVTAQPAVTPAFVPQPAATSAYAPQAAVAPADSSPMPSSEIPAPKPLPAGGAAPKPSTTDKLTKILEEARQILEQAKQRQQATKQQGANAPAPGQPMPPSPNGFPSAPDGAPGPQPAQSAPAEVAPAAAGVVIGYDANNQPIFAPPQPAAATPPPQYPSPHS